MKAKLDPAATRQSILDACARLFSERGYAGTSIADIAKEAGVPKSLVVYHFGSKDEIWSAVARDFTRPIIDLLMERESGDPAEASRLMGARYQAMIEHPEMVQMMAWSARQKEIPIPAPIAAQRENIRAVFFKDDKPNLLRLLLMSAMDGWLQNKQMYARLLGPDILDPDLDVAMGEQIVRLMKHIECRESFLSHLSEFVEEQEKEDGL